MFNFNSAYSQTARQLRSVSRIQARDTLVHIFVWMGNSRFKSFVLAGRNRKVISHEVVQKVVPRKVRESDWSETQHQQPRSFVREIWLPEFYGVRYTLPKRRNFKKSGGRTWRSICFDNNKELQSWYSGRICFWKPLGTCHPPQITRA